MDERLREILKMTTDVVEENKVLREQINFILEETSKLIAVVNEIEQTLYMKEYSKTEQFKEANEIIEKIKENGNGTV